MYPPIRSKFSMFFPNLYIFYNKNKPLNLKKKVVLIAQVDMVVNITLNTNGNNFTPVLPI